MFTCIRQKHRKNDMAENLKQKKKSNQKNLNTMDNLADSDILGVNIQNITNLLSKLLKQNMLKLSSNIKCTVNISRWLTQGMGQAINSSNQTSNQHSRYRQVSNIRCTKSQHLKDSRTVLRLSLPNPLKPDVKSRTKM